MRPQNRFLLSLMLLIACPGAPSAWCSEGVSPQGVLVGMSNALTGPAADLGIRLKAGAKVCFDKANATGGVNGRKITLISYDDAYEPGKCVANTAKLIDTDQVFALLGYVGTPTAMAAMPLVNEVGIPFLGPFTGTEALRNPVNKYVFNVRASYFDETEYLVEHLTRDLGIKNIGIMVQSDAFGAAGEEGVLKALRKRSMTLQGKGTFKRNTVEVEAGLAALKQVKPEAVIMIGPYHSLAAFVKKAKAEGFSPTFATISFVGTEAFIQGLGAESDGIYLSEVLPSPSEARVPLVTQYHQDMKAAGETIDYGSLEGYVDAAVFMEGVRKAGTQLTRASFLAAMETLQLDLGGLQIDYSPRSHQALKTVYGVKIQGGKALPIAGVFQ